ncbi:hypothetical protein CF109_03460 [Aeromonas veronii]|nr:hypothetical protein CF109_03460 [Aeromonas veronii]
MKYGDKLMSIENSQHKIVEQEFNNYQNSLVLQQSDLSLKSIAEMVNSGAIDINPSYQRRERWNREKKSDLIESFLLNIPVPPIYLAEDEYGVYSVIDGKQRVTAISDYLNGNFPIYKPESFKSLDGYTFDSLPPSLKNALSIRPYIRVVTLLKQSDDDIKHEVFLRLNKAGVALNSQEIRNVSFRGKFNDTLIELSELPMFKMLIGSEDRTGKVYREMIDVQFVLRFFTVRLLWNEFTGNMDIAMDNFMKEHYKLSGASLTPFVDVFTRTLNACYEIWGEDAFKRPNATKKILQGFYDVQMVCISLLSEDELRNAIENKDAVAQWLENEAVNNLEFNKSLTQFTSNSEAVRYRISHFLNMLRAL